MGGEGNGAGRDEARRAEKVTIPAGTMNSTSLTANATVNDITEAIGGTLKVGSSVLTATGNVDAAATALEQAASAAYGPSLSP